MKQVSNNPSRNQDYIAFIIVMYVIVHAIAIIYTIGPSSRIISVNIILSVIFICGLFVPHLFRNILHLTLSYLIYGAVVLLFLEAVKWCTIFEFFLMEGNVMN